jgi:hypothetical protein
MLALTLTIWNGIAKIVIGLSFDIDKMGPKNVNNSDTRN